MWLKSTQNAVVVQPDLASPFAAEFDEAIVLGTRPADDRPPTTSNETFAYDASIQIHASHSSAKYYMSKTLPVIVRGS